MIKHQKPFSHPLKWYEKLHRVHGSVEDLKDVDKSECECLQPIQATTLLLN